MKETAKPFEPHCPKCGCQVQTEELGDFVITSCLSCGGKEQAMVARTFPSLPRSGPVEVIVTLSRSYSAQALLALRSLAPTYPPAPPLQLLKEQLASASGVSLGIQAEYRALEIRAILEPLGFDVITIKNGERAD